MTDSRSELMALADELVALDFPWKPIGADDCLREWSLASGERDLVLSAIRLAASQPDREAVAKMMLDCQPATGTDVLTNAYERGRFDGVMEYASNVKQYLSLPSGEVVQKSDGTVIPSSDDMDARFAWLESKAIDMGYMLVPESPHPDSPHAPSDPAPGPDVREALEVFRDAVQVCVYYEDERGFRHPKYLSEEQIAALSRPVGDVQGETQTTKPTSSRTEASASETSGGVAINQHLTDVMTWLREPDWTEDASIEWLMGWVNRRPIAAVGMVAMLMPTPPVAETNSRDSSGSSPRAAFADPDPAPPAGGR